MAEARNFTFGTQLGFAKAIHKIAQQKKTRKHGLELHKILGFSFNICARAKTSNFKFGMPLGFAKAYHKNHY